MVRHVGILFALVLASPWAATAPQVPDQSKAEQAQASQQVRAAFEAGLKLSGKGKYKEAIVEYQKALAINPGQAYVLANLADALARINKNEDALAVYRKALSLKPDDAALYTNCGLLLAKIGDSAESMEMFKKSASIRPGSAARNFYNLGATLVWQGKREEAIPAFKQAIAADPNFAEAYLQLWRCLSGNTQSIPDALKALQQYLNLRQRPE